MVRETIARALASFMEGFYEDRVIAATSSDLKRSAKKFVMANIDTDIEFMWFDKELKELTGIDIFLYPFDKEKGYAWIQSGDVEILILKMGKWMKMKKLLENLSDART